MSVIVILTGPLPSEMPSTSWYDKYLLNENIICMFTELSYAFTICFVSNPRIYMLNDSSNLMTSLFRSY